MAKKKKDSETPPDSFIVLMTALSIILLAFFIIMNVIAVPDEAKTRSAIGSLIGSFGILPGGLRAQATKGKSITPTSLPMVKPKDELSVILRLLQAFAENEEGGGSLGVYGNERGVIISIGENFAFDSGSAEIKPQAKKLLDKIAKGLVRIDSKFFVQGHSDDRPINSYKYRSNWELSTARAVRTLRYLAEQAGVPAGKLAAVGYGATRPLVPNDTPKHRAMNRRVEIVIAKERQKML